jgi:NAD kinase
MEGLYTSGHAAARMNQRGIREETVETLLSFGERKRSRGADLYFMDRTARRRARDELGAKVFARIEKSLDAYVVVGDDGTLVTVAKRMRRLRD